MTFSLLLVFLSLFAPRPASARVRVLGEQGGPRETEFARQTLTELESIDSTPLRLERSLESLAKLQAGSQDWLIHVIASRAGMDLIALERFPDAVDHFELAVDAARRLGDSELLLSGLSNVTKSYYQVGRLEDVERAATEGIDLAETLDEPKGLWSLYNALGSARLQLGDYQGAIESFDRSLQIAEERGDRFGEVATLSNLGVAYLYWGRAAEARDFLELARAELRPGEDEFLLGQILHNLGDSHLIDGELAEALALHRQAMEVRKPLGREVSLAESHHSLGAIYAGLKRHDQALEHLEEARELREKLGLESELVATLQLLAELYKHMGRNEEALACAESSAEMANRLGLGGRRFSALEELADAYAAGGEAEKAFETLREATRLRAELHTTEIAEAYDRFKDEFADRERERELESLRRDNAYSAVVLEGERATRRSLIVGTLLFACLALLGWSRYALKRRVAVELDHLNSRLTTASRAAEERSVQLAKALEEIKRLEGLLPICMYCKSIRDDVGHWHDLEGYLTQHSEAHFTHGICPECMCEHHPAETV